MKTKLLTIAMTAALMLTAMTKVQAQNFDGPCLPPAHGLVDHQSAFCSAMQVIALATGANYVSFFIDITLDDLKTALAGTAPSANISIKSQTQTTTYNPNNHRWTGNITLDLAKMYIINVSNGFEIALEGMPVNPAEHPVTITGNGTTYIGFPFSTSMTLTDAFAGFAVQGDKLKDQSSTCPYNRGHWGTQIPALEPGKGYKYISNDPNDRILTFPSSK